MTRELLVAALAREIETLLGICNGQTPDDPALIVRKEELLLKLTLALLEERDEVRGGVDMRNWLEGENRELK